MQITSIYKQLRKMQRFWKFVNFQTSWWTVANIMFQRQDSVTGTETEGMLERSYEGLCIF